MLITCPSCGFSKEMSADRLPAYHAWVTCPQCDFRFSLFPTEATDSKEDNLDKDEAVPDPAAEPEDRPADQPKAGFWIRVIAALVDSVLVTLVQFSLVYLLIYVLGLTDGITSGDTKELVAGLAGIFSTFIGAVYYVFFTGYCGQTPGKMALRVKVIRTNGEEIGYGRAILREIFGKFVSAIVFGLGYLWVAFDSKKQGWHDKIAGTYVIKLL